MVALIFCIQCSNATPSDTSLLANLYSLADSLVQQAQYDSADYWYQQVQVQSERLPWWEGYVKASNARATIAYLQRNTTARLYHANHALNIGNRHLPTPHLQIALAYQHIGNAWLSKGNNDSSLFYLQQAENGFHSLESWEEMAFCGVGIGINHWRKNNFSQAEIQLEGVYQLAKEKLPDSSHVYSYAFNLLGVLYQTIGDYDKALDVSLRVLESVGNDSFLLATNYGTLGTIYWSKGDTERSISYYERQLTIAKRIQDSPLIATAYNNLSAAYFKQKQTKKARFYAYQSYLMYQKFGSLSGRKFIESCNNLAACYTEMNMPDSALHYLQIAKTSSSTDTSQQGVTYHNFAQAYRRKGAYSLAEAYFKLALEKNQNRYGDHHPRLAKQYRMLGQLRADKGFHEEALRFFQQSLLSLSKGFQDSAWSANPSIEEISDKIELLKSLRDKAESLLALAREEKSQYYELAFKTFSDAVVLIDHIRRSYSIDRSRQFFMELALPVFELAIEGSLELAKTSSKPAFYEKKAFDFAERSKAISLLTHLNELRAGEFAGLPDSLRQQERDLKLNLAFYENKLINEQQKATGRDKVRMAVWREKTVSYRQQLEELILFLESAYPRYHRLKYGTQLADIKDIQAYLPDGEAFLIAYFVGEKAVYVFGINKTELKVHRTPIRDTLLTDLKTFVQQLYSQDIAESQAYNQAFFAEWTAQAHRLYQTWAEPVLPPKPTATSRLIVIPDGWLSYLPFDLLLREASSPNSSVDYVHLPYLMKDYAIQYEYSATLLLAPETQAKRPTGLFAAFAPAYDAKASARLSRSFSPLRYNQIESQQIQQLVGGISIVGDAATEEAFRSKAGDYQILHVAAHAFTDDTMPRNSALVFADVDTPPSSFQSVANTPVYDGLLHVHEVYNLQIRAGLTVLSACKTGSGQFARGEGVMSLSRAFRYAGCPSVVMSLWQTDDKATRELMYFFYSHLQEGMDKDEALHAAKWDFLKQSPKQHPFYWAPFVLVGKADPLPSRGVPSWPFLLGGILLAAFVGWRKYG